MGGYGYPSYGYGYSSSGYGYGHGGYGYKQKRSVGHGEQVHVSGATGHTVVTPSSHAYGGAPAYGSYAPYSYAPHSYAPYYPRYGYSDYNTYPYVTATHAAYSYPSHASYPTTASYPSPSRYGYSSGSYGNVGYGTPTGYLYSRAPGYGLQGEVDSHYVQGYAHGH